MSSGVAGGMGGGFEVRRPPGKWCSLWVFYFIDNRTPHPSANTSSHSSPSPVRSPRTHKHTLFFWIDGWIMARPLRCGQVETRVLVSDVCLCWRWGPMGIFLHPMWFFLWSPRVLWSTAANENLSSGNGNCSERSNTLTPLLLLQKVSFCFGCLSAFQEVNIHKHFSTGTIFSEYHTLSYFLFLSCFFFFFFLNSFIYYYLLLLFYAFLHTPFKGKWLAGPWWAGAVTLTQLHLNMTLLKAG